MARFRLCSLLLLGLSLGCGEPAAALAPVTVDAVAGRPTRVPGLRVLTLNLAHGRGTAFHQLSTPDAVFVANIGRAARLIERLAPDVVALQEADAPSGWSGGFDQVAAIGQQTGLGNWFHGIHGRVGLWGLGGGDMAYGTALLTRLPFTASRSVAFDSSWRDTKGFVVATVRGPGAFGEVDVVSVHTDFLNDEIRQGQVAVLVEALRRRGRPLILMGDLNSQWRAAGFEVAALAGALGLVAYEPDGAQPTYPSVDPDRRLDWILISEGLVFGHHEVIDTVVSDHRAVFAVVHRGR